jgi:RNA polymerase primary sigma factor
MGERSGGKPSEDLVRQYLREIGTHPLLTAEDEGRLARAIEAGRDAEAALAAGPPAKRRRELERQVADGRSAKQRFIQSNLRLVVSIAKRYQVTGLSLLDLVQEGNLGLMRAVDKFDHRRGFKFSTYATWWIRQSIGRAIADKGRTIRVPVHMVETVSQVSRATARLTRTLGRDPTVAEVAADLGMTADKVDEARRVAPDPVSLFAPVGDDVAELVDFLAGGDDDPFEAAAVAAERSQVRAVLGALNEREQRVIELRFGLLGDRPRTLQEVGREFNVTRERVRQIEAKALSKLRHPCTAPMPGDLAAV